MLITQARLLEEKVVVVSWPNTGSNIKMAKLWKFDRVANKISEFLTTYKLYIRMRMRDIIVEE